MEHHADVLAQVGHVLVRGIDLLAPIGQGAVDLHDGDQVVHPVQGAQKGGLAAAGGADQGGDLVGGNVDVDILQRVIFPVVQVQVTGGEDGVFHTLKLLV